MPTADSSDRSTRLAGLLGGLSLATDLVAGLPLETALRTAVLASRLTAALGLGLEERRAVYFAGVLRFIGCSSFAPEFARLAGGDDMGLLGALAPVHAERPSEALSTTARSHGLQAAARLALHPSGHKQMASAHCELAARLSAMLGMSPLVNVALSETYERFDGKGEPHGKSAGAISSVARALHVAFRAEVHRALTGTHAALAAVRERRGSELDPDYADALLQLGPDALVDLSASSVWEPFLAAEPGPALRTKHAHRLDVARAFAHAVDAKSSYTLGHSSGVAGLVEAAAASLQLTAAEQEAAVSAALLHDLGRMAIPNGIWDKPGALGPVERRRMESHTHHTEMILAFSPLTQDLAGLASMAHERCDGSGYPRRAAVPDKGARLLAVADAYHAMTEDRAHRPALGRDAAARSVIADAKAGRFDRVCASAVLEAAGQKKLARVRGGWPAQLSEREVEVLAALARGRSNKQIGKQLFISEKTVQHHVTHIYAKTGISTRAAAAVFALEHGLIEK